MEEHQQQGQPVGGGHRLCDWTLGKVTKESFPPDSVISHSHCSEVHFVKNGLKSIKLHLYREIPFKYQSPCFKKMFNNRQTVIENIRVESNTKQQS